MFTLNNIVSLEQKKKKRIGRGPGSGTGTTAGKGGKGQTARTGVGIGLFEGGQTPLYRRLPKVGQVTAQKNRIWKEISVSDLPDLVKKLGSVSPELLKKAQMMKTYEKLVIVGNDQIDNVCNVIAHRFTAGAKSSIEQAKGSCTVMK